MQRLRHFLLCALVLSCGLAFARDADAPKEIKGHTALVYSVAFSPDGKMLVTADFDGVIKMWEYPSLKLIRDLKSKDGKDSKDGHTANVYCVTFNKEGTILASSSQDKTIRLWNPTDGKTIRELKGHTDIVQSIVFSPDSKLLASASADKSVRLWNPADGKEVKNLGSHAKGVYSVAFSPDGKLLASSSADNMIKIYDIGSQKETKQLKGHTDGVTGVMFTPDGKSVVSISQDRTLRVWDVGSGKETKVLGPRIKEKDKDGKEVEKVGPNEDDLHGIAFSRDGKALATSGYSGFVKVWDLEGGKATFARKLKTFGAYCVTFTPDGKALVTGHDQRVVLITPIGK
jgi:WD40 repeat protein